MKYTIAATIIGLALAAPAAAETKISIGWALGDTPTDPYAITAHTFKDELERLAPGEFDISLFPNSSLGDERELIEGLTFGTVDVAIVANAPVANLDPKFFLNDLPFLYPDFAKAHEVLDGPIGEILTDSLRGQGIELLAFSEGGFRQMINNVRPVVAPDDVDGIKFRVMQNPIFIDMFNELGGNAIPMAWSDTYTAVQQGTIDGLEIPLSVIAANKYGEITKYLSLTQHTYSAAPLMMSSATYDGLTDSQKEAVQQAAALAVAEARKQNVLNSDILIAELEAEGVTVNPVSDPAAFRSHVLPVYETFRDRIGSELLDSALAAVQ